MREDGERVLICSTGPPEEEVVQGKGYDSYYLAPSRPCPSSMLRWLKSDEEKKERKNRRS